MSDKKLSVVIPYTVPDPYEGMVGYTKGSGYWLETLADGLHRRGVDVYTLGPAYERWQAMEHPHEWYDIPLIFRPPAGFPGDEYIKKCGKKGSRWEPVQDEFIDVQLPVYGFTRGQGGYGVWADAGPREFRAIVETTRWYMDLIPTLHGFDRFDVCFPMHLSANVIAGAHYFAAGRSLTISHETCIRMDAEKLEGGWAAKNLRSHVIAALDLQRREDAPRIIAISNMVEGMLTDVAAIPQRRITVVRNPYDSRIYRRLDDFDRDRFISGAQQSGMSFENIPHDGQWLVFVGGPREFKGVEQLLRSWAIYLNRYAELTKDDVLFVIGPDLNDVSHFACHAEELGIRERVVFMDNQTPSFINEMLNVSDLGVMTSLNEGDGVVVKQPGGVGVRVVAPNSGGPAEYFTPQMGTLVASRDPSLSASSKRGYEILNGIKEIWWGTKHLWGVHIVRDYIAWTRFYAKGDLSPSARMKLEILERIADDWDEKGPTLLRRYASEMLRREGEGRSGVVVPYTLGSDELAGTEDFFAELLVLTDYGKMTVTELDDGSVLSFVQSVVDTFAEVYRIYGGRDVEAHAFADGYREELHQDDDERAERKRIAHEYVVPTFSSFYHAKRIHGLLKEAVARPFVVVPEPKGGWSETAVANFADIASDTRHERREAFERISDVVEDDALVEAVYHFNRSVVGLLGNPQIYSEEWVEPDRLGMHFDHRSDAVISALTGLTPAKVAQTRLHIAQRVIERPHLRQAFHRMLIGQLPRPVRL